MDGVIADFDSHARAHGLYQDDGELVNDGQDLSYDWWVSMQAFDGARDFYDELTGLAKVRFLTGAKRNAESYAGKAQWILNFVPERGNMILREFMTMPKFDKYLLAGPKRILIDDNKKVVDRWVQAGGIGILHKGDYQQTLAQARAAVARLQAGQNPAPGHPNPPPAPFGPA